MTQTATWALGRSGGAAHGDAPEAIHRAALGVEASRLTVKILVAKVEVAGRRGECHGEQDPLARALHVATPVSSGWCLHYMGPPLPSLARWAVLRRTR